LQSLEVIATSHITAAVGKITSVALLTALRTTELPQLLNGQDSEE